MTTWQLPMRVRQRGHACYLGNQYPVNISWDDCILITPLCSTATHIISRTTKEPGKNSKHLAQGLFLLMPRDFVNNWSPLMDLPMTNVKYASYCRLTFFSPICLLNKWRKVVNINPSLSEEDSRLSLATVHFKVMNYFGKGRPPMKNVKDAKTKVPLMNS